MLGPRQCSHALKGVVLLGALLVPGLARAQVRVTPTVTLNANLYHYNYSIVNNTSLDLSLVTINVFSLPNAVQNLTAPPGFQAAFDPGLGLVDFIEDSRTFGAGTTVSAFQFDSLFRPNPSTFQTLALDASGNLVTTQGTTLAPAAGVPEPSALAFGAACASGLLFLRRWQRAGNRRA